MGWEVIPGAKKDDVVRELLEQYRPIEHELCGDILWAVIYEEIIEKRIIVCFLLEALSDGWGFKDVYECFRPGYYNCPLRFLERTPVISAAWRTKVREYHNRQSTRT
jgi:hypothetical protein